MIFIDFRLPNWASGYKMWL